MRYEGLTLFSGMLIAVMVTANALLSAATGVWMSIVIIHVTGLCGVALILLLRRRRFSLRAQGTPWYFYIAGVIGVMNTLLNNLCYEPLGAALMLALCTVGQLFFSSLIDHFGWCGMRRYPFRPVKLVGFALMALGLVFMAVS